MTTFGVVSGEKNKWQGGTLASDGYLYAIPSNSKQILCINTNPMKEEGEFYDEACVHLIGDLPATKDKWQGKEIKMHALPNFRKRFLTYN